MNALDRLESLTEDELSLLTFDERQDLYNQAMDCLDDNNYNESYFDGT